MEDRERMAAEAVVIYEELFETFKGRLASDPKWTESRMHDEPRLLSRRARGARGERQRPARPCQNRRGHAPARPHPRPARRRVKGGAELRAEIVDASLTLNLCPARPDADDSGGHDLRSVTDPGAKGPAASREERASRSRDDARPFGTRPRRPTRQRPEPASVSGPIVRAGRTARSQIVQDGRA
jgi:hypothetical protein